MTGFIGVLSLDTAFPRIPGDVGNPQSYPMPARVRVVAAADSQTVVRDAPPPPDLIATFVSAARSLEADGAVALVSTCGFLVHVQARIAAAVGIPVLLSALSAYPIVAAALPGRPVGLLTASQAALGPRTLSAAGIPEAGVRVAGMEDQPIFREVFLAQRKEQPTVFDPKAMEAAVVTRARDLVRRSPEVGGILLECGNLPPYAVAIGRATNRPVFHLLQCADMLWEARVRLDPGIDGPSS